MPRTQRAAVVREYGESKDDVSGSKVRFEEDFSVPRDLGRYQVTVQVHATSVNPVDYKIALGNMQAVPFVAKPPLVPCFDFAGRVVQVGAAVRAVQIGDAVYGMTSPSRLGCAAEFVVVDEACVALKPPSLTFAEAASLPLVALTSMQALEKANLREGQTVLVLGGTGGTGSVGIQIARAMGAAEVFATCSANNAAMVRELGASRAIDYRGEEWHEELKGAEIGVIYDTVGGFGAWERCGGVLAPGGCFVTIAGDRQDKVTLGRVASTVGSVASRKFWSLFGYPSYVYFSCDNKRADQLNALSAYIAEGKVRPVVDRTYPLEKAADAFAYLMEGHARGKVVITITDRAGERE